MEYKTAKHSAKCCKKSKSLQQDWLNGILRGKDMSNLSQSYVSQIRGLKSTGKSHKTNRVNNYLQNFQSHYAKYQQDLDKIIKLDKKVAQTKWQNKVTYLQQSYQLAKDSQQQLLRHLEQQQQFLLDKKAPAAKGQLTARLIQTTTDKLSARTHQLLGNKSINKFTQLADWQNFLEQQNTKHKTITAQDKNITIIHPRKILRNSSLPYSGRRYAAPPLNYTPEITPSYGSQNPQAGTAIDLGEDLVVQFSPAINQLAADLGNDYIKIVNFVRQNIQLQYYGGAQKGADATLRSYAGNDIDQAALLIALLRRSNIPARFVQGVIRQPIEQAMASVGISNPNQVLTALNKAGIAHEPIIEGGRLSAIHRHYTWVSAYLPYANYRGSAADLSNKTWIPLAVAIKQDSYDDSNGISDYNYQDANINADALIINYLSTSHNQSPLLYWQSQVQTDINNNYPNLNYDDLLNRQQNNTRQLQLLPASLPFEVIATTWESHQLADEQIQSLTIQMGEDNQYLDVTLLLPEIAGKRLTLSYMPATVDDLNIINQARGMGSVEPYLVELRPVIKLDGQQVAAINSALPMASFANLKLTFNSPAGSETFNRNTLIGNYLNLTVTTQSDHFALDNQQANLFSDETRSARIMHNLAKQYNQRWREAEREMAGIMDVALIKPIPALTIISPEYNLLQTQGLISELQFKGISIDAVTNSVDAISRNNIQQDQYDFYRLSALQGSYLESNIVYTQMALAAVSADQGIRKLAQSQPILQLTPDNYQAQLAATGHPQAIKEQISSWLQAGNHAILTTNTDSIDTWSGSSWIIYNPETGHSGYFISGIYAGCVTTQAPEDWSNTEFLEALINPYSEGSNSDPLSARALFILEASNNQLGVVNQKLTSPLAVVVVDDFNNPVSNAQVEFEIRIGTGKLITIDESPVSSNSKISTTTDANGIASIELQFLKEINGGTNILLNPTDENLSQLGVTRISVAVDSNLGKIPANGLFTAFAQPDNPVEIDVVSTCVHDQTQQCLTPTGFAGVKGNVYHYRVIDQFGNFVSNVPIDITTSPELTTDNSPHSDSAPKFGFGPFPYSSTGKIAMKYDDCHEFSMIPLDCAQQSVASQSDYFWTTFIPYHPIIYGAAGAYDFELSLSNTGIPNSSQQPLPEISLSYQIRDPDIQGGGFYGSFSSNYFGPFGKYEASTSGNTVSTPRKYLFSHVFKRVLDFTYQGFFDSYGVFSDRVDDSDYSFNLSTGTITVNDTFLIHADTRGIDKNVYSITGEPALYNVDIRLGKCITPGGSRTIIGVVAEGAAAHLCEVNGEEAAITREYPVKDYFFIASIAIKEIFLLYTDAQDQSLKSPVAIQTEILPVHFKPENIVLNVYKDNELFFTSKSEYPASGSSELLFDPKDERLNGIYEVEIIMNHNNPFEISSQRVPINVFSEKIVESVSCENSDEAFTD